MGRASGSSTSQSKMPLRRSTRLAEPTIPVKRQATQVVDVDERKKRRTAEKAVAAKEKSSIPQTQETSPNDSLSSLPLDIFTLIMDEVKKDPATMCKLGRTSKRFYSLIMPLVHKRVAVSAAYHVHITNVIRQIQGHLTVAQNKQLKREGKYKGQTSAFPRGLDESLIPGSAAHVRQFVVGSVDPGKKHRYILPRYIEEALKNMKNLEIFDSTSLTQSMAESLAKHNSLKALRLYIKGAEDDALAPLSMVRNLKYLRLEGCRHFGTTDDGFGPLLENSASTLVELDVETCSTYCFSSWIKGVAARSEGESTDAAHSGFPALKSFGLSGARFDSNDVDRLFRVVDFTKLQKLCLGRMEQGTELFFKRLTSPHDSETAVAGMNLQSLILEMTSEYSHQTSQQEQREFRERIRFIAMFGTLKSLELRFYRKDPITVKGGPPEDLLDAIFKHKGLKSLKMRPWRNHDGSIKPRLSPSVVATILSKLVHLEEFECSPELGQFPEVVQELSKGPNLTHFNLETWEPFATLPSGSSLLMQALTSILRRDGGRTSPGFVWENHTKIRFITVGWRKWEIASDFGEPRNGMQKPEIFACGDDSERTVQYRDARATMTQKQRKQEWYGPVCDWTDRVAKELS